MQTSSNVRPSPTFDLRTGLRGRGLEDADSNQAGGPIAVSSADSGYRVVGLRHVLSRRHNQPRRRA